MTAAHAFAALAFDASLVLQFAGAERPLLETLTALDQALVEIPRLDHAVAHTKLAWWREEIARWIAGTPRHPLTRALPTVGRSASRIAEIEACFQARFQALDLTLVGFAPATAEETLLLIDRQTGSLARLSLGLATDLDPAALGSFARHLGRARGFRDALLTAAGSTEEQAPHLDGLREALAGLMAFERAGPPPLTPYLIEATLLRSRLPRHRDESFPVRCAPLAQCWRAWRVARRMRQTDTPRASSTDTALSE